MTARIDLELPIFQTVTPRLSADGRYLLFSTVDATLVAGDTNNVSDIFVMDRDADHDGLIDSWETTFGLDPASSADASLDPDGDGLTSLQEYQQGGHPTGTFRRYLAEGAHNEFFSTSFALLNPAASQQAHVMLRLTGPDGHGTLIGTAIDPSAVATPSLRGVGAPSTFSTVVESDRPIVADRTMRWGAGGAAGSHLETAVTAPATEWYLAEGATHGSFDLFYLLQNTSESVAQVTVQYLRSAGGPITKVYTVAPQSRRTIWVDDEGPELAAVETSAHITSTQPIIVERAMYASQPGLPFAAGHEGAGVTAPALRWFFAEGATGSFFDLFVLLANPGMTASQVRLTYLLPDGAMFTKDYGVAAQSRLTLSIDGEDPRLLDTSVSIIAESLNGQPIIAERAMWWPSPNWYEAHLSAGSTTTGTQWAVAAGLVSAEAETYILIANTSATAGNATVSLLPVSGSGLTPLMLNVPLPANSRVNVPVSIMFPEALNRGAFGAIITSDGPEIVVERAQYVTRDGVLWSEGAAALAAKLQ